MRLIDADKLIEEMESLVYIHGRQDHINASPYFINGAKAFHEMVLNVIAANEEIEATPIIRCMNCRLNGTDDCAMSFYDCDMDKLFTWNDGIDFCSHGER